jgi:hypothetical protein
MGASTQVLGDGDGFDRPAAEAYLQALRAQTIDRTLRSSKVVRHGPMGAAEIRPAAPSAGSARAVRKSSFRRTWAAGAMAVALPGAIGLTLGVWTLSKPAPSPTAPVSQPLQGGRPAVEAYVATAPVPVAAARRRQAVSKATLGPSLDEDRANAATQALNLAQLKPTAAAVEAADSDSPAVGILDPAPARAGRADSATDR